MFGFVRRTLVVGSAAALLASLIAVGSAAANPGKLATFNMQVASGAKTCLPDAKAAVQIKSLGPVEVMSVDLSGLPPNTEFDLFVLQVPTAPFGVAWYQGDVETGADGRSATHHFIGRFSIETFAMAPGVAPAPLVFRDGPFPDVGTNPAFKPVHMFHLGLWFNSPADAVNARCTGTVTPFNGEHHAGIQVLNTAQFPAEAGPLRQIGN